MNLYDRVKDANHKSANLTRFLKKNKNCRVYIVALNKKVRLMDLRSVSIRTAYESGTLRLGNLSTNDKGYVKLKNGVLAMNSVTNILLHPTSKPRHVFGYRDHFVLDVTDKFVAEYNKHGMCTFHNYRHEFEDISPRKRKCSVCGATQKKYVEVKRKVKWKYVG